MTTSQRAVADVLMITHARPQYVAVTLPHLLDTADDSTRVWLWHNGDNADVLDLLSTLRRHPRVYRFHHSPENLRLRSPTNWLWTQSDADLVGKVDDDCLVEAGWVDRLRAAHADHDFGVIGSWRFRPEDFRADLAAAKTTSYPGGHQLLRNLWIQGSGYLVPRSVVLRTGPLREGQSFTRWCIAVAKAGLHNGWLLPFIQEEHLDDPRSPQSPLRTDADLLANLPLSAQVHGIRTLEEWTDQMRRSAFIVQAASLDPSGFGGWRSARRSIVRRMQKLTAGRSTW